MKKLYRFIYFCLSLFLSFSVHSFAQKPGDTIVVVADDNYPPYMFRTENNELEGILVDEWKLWEEKTGVHVKLQAYDWSLAYSKMVAGKADVLETVFFNSERAKIFDYTQAYAQLEVPVFYHSSLSGIKDVQTLRGFAIGVKKGDACIDILKQNGITTLKEYNSYESIIKAAGEGEVRVFCIDRPPATYYLFKYDLANQFKTAFVLYVGEFHRAVKKGNTPLLNLVKDGFAKISQNETDEIEKRWLGTAIGQPRYFSYAIYIFCAICVIILILVVINLILRRKVDEKTKALQKAIAELSVSEGKYREIFETANEGICITDADDNITSVNEKFAELTGYTVDELSGKNYRDLVLPEELDDYNKIYEERKKGKRGIFERTLRKKDNSTVNMLVSTTSIFENSEFTGTIEMLTDISKRKLSEGNLRKFFLGVQQSPASIIIVTAEGKIDYVNEKFIEMSGFTHDELVGKKSNAGSAEHVYATLNKNCWGILLSGEKWSGEIKSYRKNGDEYWESAIISPVMNEKGKWTHSIAIKEDITEKRKMIEDLIAAKEKAEEMNRLKSNFLANMSHELRTPLVGILGFSEILISMLQEGEEQHLVQNIYKGGKRLSDTLNMILDLSKIESDSNEIQFETVNINALTKDIAHSYAAAASNKLLALAIVEKGEGITAKLDKRLLRSILNNLINNAIKYTVKGGITIEIGTEVQAEKPHIYIKVTDTGIGIGAKNINLIFEEFRQASEGYDRTFEGTGLGLTITKKATELMNGTISVESTVGIGSVFTVRFPLGS